MDTFKLTQIKTLEVLAPIYLDYAFEKVYSLLELIKENFNGCAPEGFCNLAEQEEEKSSELVLVLSWYDDQDDLAVELIMNMDGEVDLWMYELGLEDQDGFGLYFENDKDLADYISKLLKRFAVTKDKNLDSELKKIELSNR
jgi:hypothetical protein